MCRSGNDSTCQPGPAPRSGVRPDLTTLLDLKARKRQNLVPVHPLHFTEEQPVDHFLPLSVVGTRIRNNECWF